MENRQMKCIKGESCLYCGSNYCRFVDELYQLKIENEKLKKQVCGLRPELKSMIDKICCKYNIEAKYYHEKIIEIINKLDKYKQTLIEIKEICDTYQMEYIVNNGVKLLITKILQIIEGE